MRLLGWGGRSGKGKSRWEGGDFLGGSLLIYLLELVDAISFHSVGGSRGNGMSPCEQPLINLC